MAVFEFSSSKVPTMQKSCSWDMTFLTALNYLNAIQLQNTSNMFIKLEQFTTLSIFIQLQNWHSKNLENRNNLYERVRMRSSLHTCSDLKNQTELSYVTLIQSYQISKIRIELIIVVQEKLYSKWPIVLSLSYLITAS